MFITIPSANKSVSQAIQAQTSQYLKQYKHK